jgi:hypothetical protein
MGRAWRKYRSIKDRDAVYIYLASVLKVIMRWRLLGCAQKKSTASQRLTDFVKSKGGLNESARRFARIAG